MVEQLQTLFSQSDFYPKIATGHERISGEKCILAFLWYASNEAASFRDIADRFNVSVSTLHSIINKVARFLSNQARDSIKWPTPQECQYLSQEFEAMGFPGAIGCIDGSHIRIDTPREDQESYLNRKKYHSIQVIFNYPIKLNQIYIL